MFKSITAPLLGITTASLMLVGCASSDDNQKQINMLAEQRASILSTGLPFEYGPLNVLRANAKQGVIELMMIYNADGANLSAQNLMSQAVDYYCSNKDVKNTLEVGVNYRLMLRNPRGQLLLDQFVTMDTCQTNNK